MMTRSLLQTLLLFSIQLTKAIRPLRTIDILNGQQNELSADIDNNGESVSMYGDIEELYLEQPLDHFPDTKPRPRTSLRNDNNDDTRTLRQRYFYSARYAYCKSDSEPEPETEPETETKQSYKGTGKAPSSNNAYVFLCVGGEGPSLDKSVLLDSVHCSGDMIELARILHENHGASVHMFALEHRFYGSSYPVFASNNGTKTDCNEDDSSSPVTNEHLVYLSSRQALADLARFMYTMNNNNSNSNSASPSLSLPSNIKWVTFGGSYPGMLAAWARLKYPHLVYAAVSNSAPIKPTLNFAGYNDLVSSDARYNLVGGSDACLHILTDGHAEIANTLSSGRREEVADLFHICNVSSLSFEKNVDIFLGDGVIQIPAQGNDPSCTHTLCNIEKLCSAMIKERKSSTAMQTLAAISRLQGGEECINLDWNRTLEYLSSPTLAQEGGLRSWLWQTCTEFGFYQTCQADSQCPYGRGYHKLEMDFEICEIAFGIDRASVVQNVNESMAYYGGWDLNTTRIISVNGDVDPWSVLALTGDNGSKALPTHLVHGASHHFWTHVVKESDDEEVTYGRYVIHLQIMEWLQQEVGEITKINEATEK